MVRIYKKKTSDIEVSVYPVYLEHQSDPNDSHYAWAYNIRLENKGKEAVQLLARHWKITDSNGYTKEVKGPGVVGEQPVLKPGEIYEYASGTLLPTPSGVMFGTYQMVDEGGEPFDVVIPAFSLDSPSGRATLH